MTIELDLDDRRRAAALRVQLFQQMASVVVLAPAALHRVRSHAPFLIALGAVEVVAIALASAVALRDLRGRGAPFRRFDPLNALVGTILLVEYAVSLSGGGKRFTPTLLTALAYWALTLLGPHLQERSRRRRRLTIDEDRITVRVSRLRTFRIAWADVGGIVGQDRSLRFTMKDGSQRTLSLGRYGNRDEIRSAVARGAAKVSIPFVEG